MPKISDFSAIRLRLASPEVILAESHGEVTKPETINYRTQKPEKDGLFCERIFGPEKDYECYCGKYRRIRYKGIICDKCGVEVTRAAVRRERMGHIKLAVPVAHIWFLRGIPSRMGMALDVPVQQLEKVVYYASYIVHWVDEVKRDTALKQIDDEYKRKIKEFKDKEDQANLKASRDQEVDRLCALRPSVILSEIEYHTTSLKYGEVFAAATGSEAVRKIMEKMDLEEIRKELIEEISTTIGLAQKKAQRRLSLIRRMSEAKIRPEWMFVTMLPILPPDLRPMVQLDGGRYATSDLNDLYRRVINRNNRLKKLQEINAPEIICRNEKRMLQEAVDALIDNSARKGQTVTATTGGKRLLKSLADMLKGKQGRFRQNLLGKRVDYSGRSVIVVGPSLKLHQCGLPKKMALELFRPFVIQKIIERELAYNVRAAGKIIEAAPPEVWDILEEVIKGKYVLLNRAPTLHRLGIQAFQPILVEGEAIKVHPLVCTAFNADFDGDQMAVHLPLAVEAQEEAGELMLSSHNLIKPATGSPIVTPTKDIVLGAFWMSKILPGAKGEGMVFATGDDAVLANDCDIVGIKAKIKIAKGTWYKEAPVGARANADEKYIETCAGRVIFNRVLPDDFGFVNEEFSAKMLKNITTDIIERYTRDEAAAVLDRIKDIGFNYSTISGVSWAMGDLEVPKEKAEIINRAHASVDKIKEQFAEGLLSVQERRNMIIDVWHGAKNEVTALVPKYLDPHGSVAMIISSGARGSWSQPNQMMGMKGLVINPAGQTMELPVESSFKEGFTALEYFISTHGARKGTADTALRTATAGYLTRRLVDVSQDVVVGDAKCSDKEGFIIRRSEAAEVGLPLEEKIVGRNVVDDIKIGKDVVVKAGDMIDAQIARRIDGDESILEVAVYSPLTCKAERGVCIRCYGWDLGQNKPVKIGATVGVVAAQAIGEPGTQLTMRTFHTGGVAGGADITQGLPRVEEIFEARAPKGRATVADVDGVVEEVIYKENERIIRVALGTQSAKTLAAPKRKKKSATTVEENTREYVLPPNVGILVEKGDLIAPGVQLSEGHMDLKELFEHVGMEPTVRYIVNEVQKIYTSQGASIHDKHIEVIIRQMFSRVQIEDSGDSTFSPGEVVERSEALSANRILKQAGKKEAKVSLLLLGITKVALTTTSFLSSASFQETARVLIEASIEGRVDRLRGLKENVIIGKLIPAGTGYGKQ
ncbi:MAG: DNA-directed RNA polymerase subunit beta' [Candidatus Spechtbacteria bacterium]|nr:DNA-directed RNA polymerase subunit beta' [Candidatus Spechtbacteria bacterium]